MVQVERILDLTRLAFVVIREVDLQHTLIRHGCLPLGQLVLYLGEQREMYRIMLHGEFTDDVKVAARF